MPPVKNEPARVKVALAALLARTLNIYRGKDGAKVEQIPLLLPAMMIMESANRFVTGRKSFGKSKGSIDQALDPFFRLAFNRPARTQAFLIGWETYAKLADSISAKTKVGTRRLRTYCATEPAQRSLQSVLEVLAAEEQVAHLRMADIARILETTGAAGIESRRTVKASVDLVACKDPEEQQWPDKVRVCVDLGPFGRYCQTISNPFYGPNSGDEIYVTSFGAVFSTNGYKLRRSLVSSVYSNIGTVSGHHSSLQPGAARYPLNDVLARSLDSLTYYAYYSFSLFEQEYSEEERRQALAQAALDATEAVMALLQADWIGLGVNIAQLLYDLAVALDDDDCLGSVGIRYDDIGRLPSLSLANSFAFDDTHLLNHYRYEVQSGFVVEA